MSARATRGPAVGVVAASAGGLFRAGSMTFGRTGASCLTNQSRSDSSEMLTPIEPSDAAMIRTEVPALRSLRSTALYGSRSSALVVLAAALASAINAANLWASVWGCFVIDWEKTGESLGEAKENTNAPAGKNLRVIP